MMGTSQNFWRTCMNRHSSFKIESKPHPACKCCLEPVFKVQMIFIAAAFILPESLH
jgi:hypothetical protein